MLKNGGGNQAGRSRSFVGACRETWVDAALTRASRLLQKKTATAAPLALSLDRGCRFSLFSAKPRTPMLNFFARSGAKDQENRQPLDRERDLGRKRERIEKGG